MRLPQQLTRRQVIAATATAVAAVSISDGSAFAASSVRATGSGRPAIVLVHGAFTDGSCWSDVIVALQARGYPVTAVQNPLTSLADDVTATRRALARQSGPVILVGHSWAGAVITEAGTAPNVMSLVYVSALAPDKGEAVTDLQLHGPVGKGMDGAKPDAEGLVWFDPRRYGEGLAADLPSSRVELLAATQQPIAGRCFSDTLSAAAWREKPSHYLLSTRDQVLGPAMQRWMADRMKASVLEVPSSHMSLISHANAVVDLIGRAHPA